VTRDRRYREEVVRMGGTGLVELDGKEVRREEREWLQDREKERERRRKDKRVAGKERKEGVDEGEALGGRGSWDGGDAFEWKERVEEVDAGMAGMVLLGARTGSREGKSENDSEGMGEVVVSGIPAGRHSRHNSNGVDAGDGFNRKRGVGGGIRTPIALPPRRAECTS
jgi:hypothetical protein